MMRSESVLFIEIRLSLWLIGVVITFLYLFLRMRENSSQWSLSMLDVLAISQDRCSLF